MKKEKINWGLIGLIATVLFGVLYLLLRNKSAQTIVENSGDNWQPQTIPTLNVPQYQAIPFVQYIGDPNSSPDSTPPDNATSGNGGSGTACGGCSSGNSCKTTSIGKHRPPCYQSSGKGTLLSSPAQSIQQFKKQPAILQNQKQAIVSAISNPVTQTFTPNTSRVINYGLVGGSTESGYTIN